MKKVIFNADDFNLTYGVCKGIVKTNQFGVVQSTSVMVNLPGIEESLRLCNDSSLDLGLHINLTFGKPVLPSEMVSSLVDEKGNFYRKHSLLKEKAKINEIKLEIEAQFEKARKLNINISHLDSHHNIHLLKGIYDVYKEIAKSEKLPLRSNTPEMTAEFKDQGLITPDNFIDTFYYQNVRLDYLMELTRNMPEGITEIMCHPGYIDSGLMSISHYNLLRKKEFDILTNPELKTHFESLEIAVIGYTDLK